MPDFDQLTKRQHEVLEFIRASIRDGYAPTVREIGDAFGISSPNGVICHLRALEKKGLIEREPHKSRTIRLADAAEERSALPLVGRIAAGVLHEAVEQQEHLDLSSWVEPGGDLVALEVSGDSMIDDHIADGDVVIIRRQKTARKGQIVVAETEEGEATLKRWFPEANRIRLEPANANMKPIYVKNAKVYGVVVGVVRKLM